MSASKDEKANRSNNSSLDESSSFTRALSQFQWLPAFALRKRTDDADEQHFLRWLLDAERRAILPFKWALLVTAICFWLVSRTDYQYFHVQPVNALFFTYMLMTLLESFRLRFFRIEHTSVRRIALLSYASDYLFVLLLNLFAIRYSYASESGTTQVFLLLFFLLILRGMTVFKTARGALSASVLSGVAVSVILLSMGYASNARLTPIAIATVLFVGLTILGTWLISGLILSQKEELMSVRDQMARKDNLAMVGQLASGLAHEINNPIGIISAYSEFLMRQAPADDEKRKDYEAIFAEAQRCKNIVGDLLMQVRTRPPSPTNIHAIAFVTEIFERAIKTAMNPIRLTFDTQWNGIEKSMMFADREQMSKAFVNIALNAVAALEQVAEPTIQVKFAINSEQKTLGIEVRDNGCGFASGDTTHVFEPFFTTKSKGTGLGLWVTHEAVAGNGGNITVGNYETSNGSGALVVVELPLATGATD